MNNVKDSPFRFFLNSIGFFYGLLNSILCTSALMGGLPAAHATTVCEPIAQELIAQEPIAQEPIAQASIAQEPIAQASPTPTPSPNYIPLQRLLAAKNWKAADQETRQIMQQWVHPNGDRYAAPQHDKIPCEGLRTIDTLWVQASNGQFGWSVQQKYWQQSTHRDPHLWVESFGKRVGWRRLVPLTDEQFQSLWFAPNWLMEDELQFTSNAPVGHLPWSGTAAAVINALLSESGPACGSCSIDAIYLQEERFYKHLPGLFDRVKTCLASTTPNPYTPLKNALAAGNWREANKLTSLRVLELAGQKQRGYLIATDIRKLPCQDLKTIDQLWKQHSNGRFGFSVQAQIWQSIPGKKYEDSLRFEDKVGWHQPQPIFNLNAAPPGHLPLRPALSEGIMNAWGGGWLPEMPLRLKSCGP